ncbi:MAG: hypothetical protein H6741_25790 [Alphaproteobacteria bacterium]|nr:hypothetical protein [Alphaproteobacteria bacterium]MCB9796124.1 hypothetical protein [Alphaproteobacteria bacterium]
MTEEEAFLLQHRRRMLRRQARAAVRGVAFAVGVIALVLSGVLPMGPGTQTLLLGLAGFLAVTRALRGLWAMRVARHLMRGWSARRLPQRARFALPAPPAESADRRAVLALTELPDEPLVARAREHGLALADRMGELKDILADAGLSAALRRPVAEELARVERELEELLSALGELSGADRRQRVDLLTRLAARLEVDAAVPEGLYAPA